MRPSQQNLWDHIAGIRSSLPFLGAFESDFPKGEIYLVGGAVRDLLLNRKTKDYDFLIRHVAASSIRDFLLRHGKVSWVGKTFGVYKFYPTDGTPEAVFDTAIDVALPRTERSFSRTGGYKDFEVESDASLPIEEDLRRRDFTVNAMAADLKNKRLIDPYGGLSDLECGCLRAVGDPVARFTEDTSRLLRGLRLACQFPFFFEERSWDALRGRCAALNAKREDGAFVVPRETIAREFIKAVVADPVRGFDLWDQSGAFTELIPELLPMKGCPQPDNFHSEGDVWTHTRLALSQLTSQGFRKEFDGNYDAEAVLAVLFHDVAKPVTIQTPEREGTDRIRFNNHDRIGARMVRDIATRLKLSSFPKGSRYYVDEGALEWLIQHHLILVQGEVDRMRASTLEKYFLNPQYPGKKLMQLIYCDGMATVPRSKVLQLTHYAQLKNRLERIEAITSERAKIPPPLLTGNEVMQALKILPGPAVGKFLALIREEQLSERISTRDEAMTFLEKENGI